MIETRTTSIDRLDIVGQFHAPSDVHDELKTKAGECQPHWTEVVDGINGLGTAGLEGRRRQADGQLHEHGVTFNAFGENSAENRPWQLDVLPFVMAGDDWQTLEKGIAQRARLLDQILRDLYGPRDLLKSGLLPVEAVYGHPGYHQSFRNLLPNHSAMLHLYSVELARSANGRWWAMADRSDRNYGIGYALENRIVISRSMPNLIHRCRVERLASFFLQVQQTMSGLANRATEFPRVVLLSEGPSSPVYFEDQYLARYLGYTLVEGGDLAVRNDIVSLKTLDGLLPVDVIYRRIPERLIDPLELGGASPHGIPGLLQAVRLGNVAVANAPGTGLLESPVFMPYLRGICQKLLGEELLIPSIATWWCHDPEARKYVLANLDELVVKPAFKYSGSEEFIVSEMDSRDREKLRAEINARPADFVAQELVRRSSAPTWANQKIGAGHIAIRAFATWANGDYTVMPGGLVRVASDAGPMELSIIAGESSKDAWVISDKPVSEVSLLPPDESPLPITRATSQLPSRAADNLFWFGRHIDRAETSARLLRSVADRLATEGGLESTPELTALLRVLAADGQIEPGVAVSEISAQLPQLEDLLPKSLFDEREPSSLRSTINELVRLASTVRDLISNDTWRTISHIDEEFRPDIETGETPLSDSLDGLDSLIIGLAACSGLISDGMVRGPAWRFLDMGRRLERCACTISLLQHSICSEVGELHIRRVAESLLDVVDCRTTYRSRYLARVQLTPVLDLLVTDESNPRSIGNQLAALSEHVDALPRDPNAAWLTNPQKLIRTAVHELRLANLDQLCRTKKHGFENLERFLETISDLITKLGEDVTRRYLVHSGTPRQVTDEDSPV